MITLIEEQSTGAKTRVSNQKVISKLFQLNAINQKQLVAAMRLYNDYCHGCGSAISSSLVNEKSDIYKKFHKFETITIAKSRFSGAMNIFSEEELEVIKWTVINDNYLKYFCRIKAGHSYSDMTKSEYQAKNYKILRHALDLLSNYYETVKSQFVH